MPATEEPGAIKSQLWTLTTKAHMRELQDALEYLGVDASVWTHCHPEAAPGRMEIPDTTIRTNPTVKVEKLPARIRTTTLDALTLINIELLPEAEAEA